MKSYNELFTLAEQPRKISLNLAEIISKQRKLPLGIVRKGISQGFLKINRKSASLSVVDVCPGTIIHFQNSQVDISNYLLENVFDNYVKAVLFEIGEEEIESLKLSSRKIFGSYLISFFANNPLDKIIETNPKLLQPTITTMETFYREMCKQARTPKRKELVEILVQLRNQNIEAITGLVQNLLDGTFSSNLYKFLQDYTRLINKDEFQFAVAPQLS